MNNLITILLFVNKNNSSYFSYTYMYTNRDYTGKRKFFYMDTYMYQKMFTK